MWSLVYTRNNSLWYPLHDSIPMTGKIVGNHVALNSHNKQEIK